MTSLLRARQSLKYVVESGGFDRVLDKVHILSAGDGKLTAEMTVDQSHSNQGGSLHGGFIATLVDHMSTLALMSLDESPPGVSVDLNIQYMSPAIVGSDLYISATAIKKGRSVSFLTVDVLDRVSNKLVARGTHVKFVTSPKL